MTIQQIKIVSKCRNWQKRTTEKQGYLNIHWLLHLIFYNEMQWNDLDYHISYLLWMCNEQLLKLISGE